MASRLDARRSGEPDLDAARDAVLRRAVDLGTDQPDVKAAAATLLSFAQGDPELLEGARSVFIERLHARSDDFDATGGLRLVEEALRRLRYPSSG